MVRFFLSVEKTASGNYKVTISNSGYGLKEHHNKHQTETDSFDPLLSYELTNDQLEEFIHNCYGEPTVTDFYTKLNDKKN